MVLLNPSSSNDFWFDDRRNMEELNRAIDELKEGKANLKELSDDEIKGLFAV
jgi:hypothetical protein